MKWIFTILLLVSAAGSCEPLNAKSKDWTEKERKLWHSYIALSTIDTIQTVRMIDCQKRPHCPLVEKNPILGKRPEKHDLIALKLVGNAIIYNLLDRDDVDREKALKWLNGTQAFVVTHNGFAWYKRF